jgi:hypothetical protein
MATTVVGTVSTGNNINNTASTINVVKSKPLLFEHLPDVRFKTSPNGVLFIIFANGDAYFFALNDQYKNPTSVKPHSSKSNNKQGWNEIFYCLFLKISLLFHF